MVNIRDIAKKSGVSPATVSRVINNPQLVSPKKRENILKVIEEYKFIPNRLAVSLIKKKSRTVGLLIPVISNLFFPEIIEAIEGVLYKEGFNLFLSISNDSIEEEKNAFQNFLQMRIEGAIVIGSRRRKYQYIKHIIKSAEQIPIVLVNEYLSSEGIYCVYNDESWGAYRAVKYLVESGHRNIGFINGNIIYSTFFNKLEGYKQALLEAKLSIKDKLIVSIPKNDVQNGYQGTIRLLEQNKKLDGLFVCSDFAAIGVLRALQKRGIHIPKDISVIGYDNISISSMLSPSLATVDQQGCKLGTVAAKLIKRLIDGEKIMNNVIKFYPNLIIRESVKSKL